MIKEKIKKTRILKKLRSAKRIYKLVDRYMFTKNEVRLGESSSEKMVELVRKQLKKWPERGQEQNKRIDWLKSSPLFKNNINLESLRNKMLFYYFAYGFSPSEFLIYGLDGKSKTELNSYISDRESVKIAYQLNDIDTLYLFKDKYKTFLKLKKYFHRDVIAINSETPIELFLDFTEKNPIFLQKDALESCGRGIDLINLHGKSQAEKLKVFHELKKQENVILEELIKQSEKLSSINDTSVNTVRCFTFKTKEDIKIPWCFGKLGRKGYFIDNGAAGGLLVGIDVSNGHIIPNSCYDEFGQNYQNHPDNEFLINDFVYPDWEDMILLCKEMANQFPEAPWIGWDMAHTDEGWVLVEGNSVTEVIGPQSTLGHGIKAEFKELMKQS